MKIKHLAIAVLSAIALDGTVSAADFKPLDKITAAEQTVQAVSQAVSEELHEYPGNAWAVLRVALSKITSDWTADEVTEMIRLVFGVMPLDEVERVLPQVKTLVDWYSDAYAEGVPEQVIANLDAFQSWVDEARSSDRSVNVVTDRTEQTAPSTPDEEHIAIPAMPSDVSVN